MKPITKTDIKRCQLINSNAKKWAIKNLDYLNKGMTLFGSSVKVEKGALQYSTYVMYLQPADKVAMVTLCAGSDAGGCKPDCLIQSGQLGMSVAQNAATKRTILMLMRPQYFNARVLFEVDRAESKAKKSGIPALFRLNGTSDNDFSELIAARPDSQWYDYTKILSRVRKNKLANYDLTFSASMFSKQSKSAFKKAVKSGYRIAVAFNTKLIASDRLALPDLTSFDKTDLRHLDGAVIGTLTRKGSNINQRLIDDTKENSFFVTSANLTQFQAIAGV